MNERDQKIYRIARKKSNMYNVYEGRRCIAESITMIEDVSIAIYCDYMCIPPAGLYIEGCKVKKREDDERIIRELNCKFLAVKFRDTLDGYKICGLLIGKCING